MQDLMADSLLLCQRRHLSQSRNIGELHTKKYVLSGDEVNEIAGEVVGQKLTNSMDEMILKKAGHRIVYAAESDKKILISSGMETGQCNNTETMGNSMHGATAGILAPPDITFIQESEVQRKKGELLPDYTGAVDVDGTNIERTADKTVHVMPSTTEETNIKQTGAKVRKEGEEQKLLDAYGHFSIEDLNMLISSRQ